MNLPTIGELSDSKLFVSLASMVVGGLAGSLLTFLRNRVKTLEYTVDHNPVGFSAEDAIFGSIRVTWQNHNVTNLFSTRVTLENQTGKDFNNLKIKIYTGDTLLLTEKTEILGTTYVLQWTESFQNQLRVTPGQTATEQQYSIYNHSREYQIPVLNRGQRVVVTLLTTVPNGTAGPLVWLDSLHEGACVKFRPGGPQVHGAPLRAAISLGLVCCFTILILSGLFIAQPWAAGLVCMLFGLWAQAVGALIFRTLKLLKALLLR